MKPAFFLLSLIISFSAITQQNYAARVVSSPNFLMDLYQLETERRLVNEVEHLKSIQVSFGLAGWEWRIPGSYFCDLTSIKLKLDPIHVTSFIMYMPGGGERIVKLEEAGISPDGGIIVEGIKLQVEFGKPGVMASIDMSIHNVPFGQAKTVSGDLRFKSDEDCQKVREYINANGGWSSVDPQVTIISKGRFLNDFKIREIRNYITKVYADYDRERQNAVKRQEGEALLAQARTAESNGDLEGAKSYYQQAYSKLNDSSILDNVTRINQKIRDEESANNDNSYGQDSNSGSDNPGSGGYSSGQGYSNYSNNGYSTQRNNEAARRAAVDSYNDNLVKQGNAIYESTKTLGNPFYNNTPQIWPQNSNGETAEQRAIREADEEWEEEQQIRREEEQWRREVAERERREREEAERRRKEQEENARKAEQAKAERASRFQAWMNTTQPTFTRELTRWKNEANQYINGDLQKYGFFQGASLPHWMDFYSAAAEKIVSSTTIQVEDKSRLLYAIAAKTYDYYNVCTKYNFEGALEPNTWSAVNTVFRYAKAVYGYSPASEAYNYLTGYRSAVNPVPKKKITKQEVPVESTLSKLNYFYKSGSNADEFLITPELFYKRSYNSVYGSYNEKPTVKFNSGSVNLPLGYGIEKTHKDFVDEAITIRSRNAYGKPDFYLALCFELLGRGYYNASLPAISLNYYRAEWELFNIMDVDSYLDEVTHRAEAYSISSLYRDNNGLYATIDYTGSVAHAYHRAGFYEESFKLFERAKTDAAVVFKNGVGYHGRYSKPGYSMYPQPKREYIYWEYYSMMIESLYLQGKLDQAMEISGKFLKEINSAFLNETLSPYPGAGKQTFVSRLYRTYPYIYGNESHRGHSVGDHLIRTILYRSKMLKDAGRLEEAIAVYAPIEEWMKKLEPNPGLFGDHQELGLALMKDLAPKLYSKEYANQKSTRSFVFQKPTSGEEWVNRNQSTIASLQESFKKENYHDAYLIARIMTFTIDPEGEIPPQYIECMQMGALAALYDGHYHEGIVMADRAQLADSGEEDFMMAHGYMILNAMLAGKYDLQFVGMENYEGADLMKSRYSLERELVKFSKTKFGNEYGHSMLSTIERTLVKNGVDSPNLCYLYTAISEGKASTTGN